MSFKVLIGKATKGGNTAQWETMVERASLHLEEQLNDKNLNVKSVQGLFVHDNNPLHAEVIAVVEVIDPVTKKKEEK